MIFNLAFFSGHFAERMNLRHFLTIGMLLSGFTTALLGLAFFLDIHWLPYYFIVQVCTPALVTLLQTFTSRRSNWCSCREITLRQLHSN